MAQQTPRPGRPPGRPTGRPDGRGGSNRPAGRAPTGRPARRAGNPLVRVGVPIAVVVVVVAVFLIVKLTGGSSKPDAATARQPIPAAVQNSLTSIPASVFDQVGVPTRVIAAVPKPVTPPGAALTADGKPEMLYVGAEYCPYCAAERWGMAVALSRFGTFSNLSVTTSSAVDVDASTATLSFYKSTYTSDYVAFTSVEETTNQVSGRSYVPLEKPTAAQDQLLKKYDGPPYSTSSGGIPFIDYANKYVQVGPNFDPALLKGMDWFAVANALNNPSSPAAQAIIGTANVISAALCDLSGQQPANVCTSAGVKAGAAALSSSK